MNILILGIVFLGIGSIGTAAAVVLEVKYKEPKYKIFMKIFPWFIGVGGVLLGMSI